MKCHRGTDTNKYSSLYFNTSTDFFVHFYMILAYTLIPEIVLMEDFGPFYQPRTKCNTNYSKYWKCGPYSTTEANLNPPNSQLPHQPWCQPLSCLQTQQCSVTFLNANTHNSMYANQFLRISDAWSNLA